MRRAWLLLVLTGCNSIFGIDELTTQEQAASASVTAVTNATVGSGGSVVSSTAATIGAGGAGGAGGQGGNNNGPKRVFVTSAEVNGDLNGIPGATSLCETAAGELGGGGWRPWLSDLTTDAINALADVGPWHLVDGMTLVAADKAQLASGQLAHPIDLDENGISREAIVWTGTDPNGTSSGGINENCNNWTSDGTGITGRAGLSMNLDGDWTSAGTTNCGTTRSLYCFEQ